MDMPLHKHANVYQASACIIVDKIPLAKASQSKLQSCYIGVLNMWRYDLLGLPMY